MFTFKSRVTGVTIGIVVFLGLEAYGFYSIGRSLDTHLSQIQSGLESVRAFDADMASQLKAQATQKEPVNPKAKDAASKVGSRRLIDDPKVAAKLQKMLPAGAGLRPASMGFRNEMQFISAVYVSKNLGIPFARLKAKMTGNRAVSMEAAIRDLRHDLNKTKAKAEAEKGMRQAIDLAKLDRPATQGA